MSSMSDRAARADSRGDMLQLSDDSIAGIAAAVGYGSEAAFNRAFKRKFEFSSSATTPRPQRSDFFEGGWFHIASDGNNPPAANVS
jgi:AraC-like DNA-binding protein